jgi:uncharacterized protein (TIGR02246 family)
MVELEARLQSLEDREAIRALIASYGPLADSGDAEGVASLWAEDGSYAIAGMDEARGHAAIAALIAAPMHRKLMADGCAHMLGPVAIDLAGDKACARGHSLVLHWNGRTFEVLRVAANRWALARGSDGWKVIRRDNALLQGSEAARALLSPPAAPRRS